MEQSKDIVTSVKNLVRALDTAARNLILYPETNEIRGMSLALAKEMMDAALVDGGVRLFVAKGRLLYNDEVVYQDKSLEHGFVSPLFRDGIHSIEFFEGIGLDEIETFITLMNTFKVLPDETDDDLVTAMWEADFKFIKYDTADEFWEADDSIDILTLKVSSASDFRATSREGGEHALNPQMPGEAEDRRSESFASLYESLSSPESLEELDKRFPGENRAQDHGAAEGGSADGAGPGGPGEAAGAGSPNSKKTFSIAQWQKMLTFSTEEKNHLNSLIEAERSRNIIADSLEILINLMYCRPEHPDNNQALVFLVDEVREALTKGDFEDVQKCIMAVMSFSQSGHPELLRLATEFSRLMANEDTLKALAQSWETDQTPDDEYLKNAYQFLVSLPPDGTAAMIPLLTGIKDKKIRSMLMWAIAYKSAYASVDLMPLFNALRPELLVELLNIFRSPHLPFPTVIVANLARHPGSSEVRQAAAEALIENDPAQIKILFPLIKDNNSSVSRMALQYLGRTRSHQAEGHLVGHLKDIIAGETERPMDHIIQCYQALGLCATQNSLPFLEHTLFKKTLKAFFGMDDDFHRQGAATALLMMSPELGGKTLIDKASASPFRSIRQACQLAMNSLNQQSRW